MFESRNPVTGEVLASFPISTSGELDRSLENGAAAFRTWKHLTIEERSAAIRRLAELLRSQSDALSATITLEMGKPIQQARGEIDKCAWLCDFYADNAADFLQSESIAAGYPKSYIRYDPLGGVLGVMPWNFPFWQALRYAVPAVLAGNIAFLKPAPNVPQCASHLVRLFAEATQRLHILQSLFLQNDQVEAVLAHPFVQGVALTGSDRAGSAVAALAGQYLVKSVLELGGSDAFIVLPDADLDRAVETAVASRMNNTGQTCIAAKRFIVPEDIFHDFLERVVVRVQDLRQGDPTLEETDLGPLARPDLKEQLSRQVQASLSQGARLVWSGPEPAFPGGAFYAARVLTDIAPGSPAWEEELFGPVATVYRVRDAQEAVQLANNSAYGLGAALWTADLELADKLAGRLQAGAVAINGLVKSDPHLPFGGVKRSGYGRELGQAGIREFVNIKAVVYH